MQVYLIKSINWTFSQKITQDVAALSSHSLPLALSDWYCIISGLTVLTCRPRGHGHHQRLTHKPVFSCLASRCQCWLIVLLFTQTHTHIHCWFISKMLHKKINPFLHVDCHRFPINSVGLNQELMHEVNRKQIRNCYYYKLTTSVSKNLFLFLFYITVI